MLTVVTQVTDHFPLTHFAPALETFRLPTEVFDPHGAWVNSYDIWECSQGSRKVGELIMERTPLNASRIRLNIGYRKTAAGGILRATMSLQCRTDELSTPVQWQAETAVHDANDQLIKDTRLSETGETTDRGLMVTTNGTGMRVRAQRPFTFYWCLFDAVQRLAGPAMRPLGFTLIDRLNHQVKPHQQLAFRLAATVQLGGRRIWREQKEELERGAIYRPVPVREGATATLLRAYNHTGQGVVPTIYWVDQSGRLLFVTSGLIAYVYSREARL